jgi:hypothetical protein
MYIMGITGLVLREADHKRMFQAVSARKHPFLSMPVSDQD